MSRRRWTLAACAGAPNKRKLPSSQATATRCCTSIVGDTRKWAAAGGREACARLRLDQPARRLDAQVPHRAPVRVSYGERAERQQIPSYNLAAEGRREQERRLAVTRRAPGECGEARLFAARHAQYTAPVIRYVVELDRTVVAAHRKGSAVRHGRKRDNCGRRPLDKPAAVELDQARLRPGHRHGA